MYGCFSHDPHRAICRVSMQAWQVGILCRLLLEPSRAEKTSYSAAPPLQPPSSCCHGMGVRQAARPSSAQTVQRHTCAKASRHAQVPHVATLSGTRAARPHHHITDRQKSATPIPKVSSHRRASPRGLHLPLKFNVVPCLPLRGPGEGVREVRETETEPHTQRCYARTHGTYPL